MRLPWNRKYMEIGFHVILTVLLLVGMIALLLRLSVAKNVILQTAGTFLAVFAPVFWAFFFTLLLEPLTAFWQRFYEKRCTLYHRSRIRNRKAGATLTYLSIGLILFLIGGFLARKIGQTNLSALTEQIGDYIRQAGDMLVLLNLKLAEMGILRNAEWIFSRWIEQATRWMQERMLWLADVIPNIGGSLLDVLLGAVVAFYLLMEKEKIRGIAGELSKVLLGEKITKHAKNLFHEVYTVFAGYLSGQLLDASVMAVLFSAAFTIVGLPHGILIGLVSGFSNLIPYFGAVMAFFPGGACRTFQRRAHEGGLCVCADSSLTAGGQHFHCAEGSRAEIGAASRSGSAFSGGFWADVWFLGAGVCGSLGCALQKFCALVLSQKKI